MMQAPDGDIRPEDGLVPESSSAPLPSQSSAHSMHVSFLQDFTVRTLLSDSISLIPQLRSCQPSSAHLCVSEKGKALPLQYDASCFFVWSTPERPVSAESCR